MCVLVRVQAEANELSSNFPLALAREYQMYESTSTCRRRRIVNKNYLHVEAVIIATVVEVYKTLVMKLFTIYIR